jgi:hypothetical protein
LLLLDGSAVTEICDQRTKPAQMFRDGQAVGIEDEVVIGLDHLKSAGRFQEIVCLCGAQRWLQFAADYRTKFDQDLRAYHDLMLGEVVRKVFFLSRLFSCQ